MTKPLVFVSYCQKDAKFRDELVAQALEPYRKQGYLDYWYDQHLVPGDEFSPSIFANLERATVTIFLVSPAFVCSNFIQSHEVPRVLAAQREGRMTVLWLLLRPMDVALVKDLAELQGVEKPTKPLSGMKPYERSEVWSRLGSQLRKMAGPVTAAPDAAPSPQVVPVEASLELPSPAALARQAAEDRRCLEAITVVTGDLTTVSADAIVVSASPTFKADGGVEQAVHAAAGPELRAALSRRGPLGVAEACSTPGFGLPARTIVHVVAPRWRGNPREDLALLHQAYGCAFTAAIDGGAQSIALGSLGTGSKGFPAEVAAGIAVEAAKRAVLKGPLGCAIRFVVQKPEVKAALAAALAAEPQTFEVAAEDVCLNEGELSSSEEAPCARATGVEETRGLFRLALPLTMEERRALGAAVVSADDKLPYGTSNGLADLDRGSVLVSIARVRSLLSGAPCDFGLFLTGQSASFACYTPDAPDSAQRLIELSCAVRTFNYLEDPRLPHWQRAMGWLAQGGLDEGVEGWAQDHWDWLMYIQRLDYWGDDYIQENIGAVCRLGNALRSQLLGEDVETKT